MSTAEQRDVENDVPDGGEFADVLSANAEYAAAFELSGLPSPAARGLAVITCMDSRIEPLRMLGIAPGDAKIMRNAGARVTPDVLRTLVVAAHFLNVRRVMVVPHTHCKMTEVDDEGIHTALLHAGVDTAELTFGTVTDQQQTLRDDVQAIRDWPYLPTGITVGGFLYDVDTGRLQRIC
jgi:carbonic anhydrase